MNIIFNNNYDKYNLNKNSRILLRVIISQNIYIFKKSTKYSLQNYQRVLLMASDDSDTDFYVQNFSCPTGCVTKISFCHYQGGS